jgi:HNH endonuclease
MNPLYARVAQRAAHRCEYCRAPEAIFNFPFEVEHVIPVSRQGADNESNLALACRACNLHKADHLTGVDETLQASVPLFHPRQDLWEEHFRVDSETGAIEGLTSVGRATVACLQMNASIQLVARQQWMRLGLFP